jgi:ABC-2 type transport system permease protein
VFVIIKREYLTRVKSKAFVIATVLMPVLMVGFTTLPVILAMKGRTERKLVVLDQSAQPELFDITKRIMENRSSQTRFDMTKIEVKTDQDRAELAKKYSQEVLDDTTKAYMVWPSDIMSGGIPEYHAKSATDFGIGDLERSLSDAVVKVRLTGAGLDPEKIADYTKGLSLKNISDGPEGGREEKGQSFIIAIIMMVLIYTTILTYGISVMRGVIEEKQSRIAEVVVSSVRPFQMMMGKLVGIGLVGLTQYMIWVASAALLSVFGVSMLARGGVTLPRFPMAMLFSFVGFFVLGYFLFATLYAIVGSIVTTEEEAQGIQFPITMVIILPMMIMWAVMKDPGAPLALVLSMIPFFAPTLMMLRVSMISPPVWQILLSMGLMLISIFGVVWLAAKIYRVGILMYGKRPSLGEIARWVRYA